MKISKKILGFLGTLTTFTAGAQAIAAQSMRTTAGSQPSPSDGVALVGASLLYLCCFAAMLAVMAVYYIYFIKDAVNRDYGADDNMKVIAILLIIFLGFPLGPILYYVLIMQKYPKLPGKK